MKLDSIGLLVDEGMATRRACGLLGYSRASYYRHRPEAIARSRPAVIPQADRHQPAALSEVERKLVLEILNRDEYADQSVGQTF